MQTIIKEPSTRNAKTTFNFIIESAINLFYKKGYHGTTVKDITAQAGIATGTFYLYFPSKLILYKHILIMLSHDIRRVIAAKVSKKATRFEKEREGIKAFILLAKEKPQMYNIIWESLYIDRELFREYYESFAKRYVKGLNQSVENKEIHPIDTEVVSFVLMGITNFVGLKVVLDLGSNNDDIDAIIDAVMQLLDKGLFM